MKFSNNHHKETFITREHMIDLIVENLLQIASRRQASKWSVLIVKNDGPAQNSYKINFNKHF